MRRLSKKTLAVVVVAVLILTTLAGCGGVSSLARPTPDPGASQYTVNGSCSISISGDIITVSGTTDVINGAFINVSVVAQDGTVIDSINVAQTGAEISQQFTVTDKYDGVVDMKGYLTIAPSYYKKQPSNVTQAYGSQFQNIVNDTDTAVWSSEGVMLVFASDWLYGIVPQTTPGPTPVPTATPEATPAVSGDAAATPSA